MTQQLARTDAVLEAIVQKCAVNEMQPRRLTTAALPHVTAEEVKNACALAQTLLSGTTDDAPGAVTQAITYVRDRAYQPGPALVRAFAETGRTNAQIAAQLETSEEVIDRISDDLFVRDTPERATGYGPNLWLLDHIKPVQRQFEFCDMNEPEVHVVATHVIDGPSGEVEFTRPLGPQAHVVTEADPPETADFRSYTVGRTEQFSRDHIQNERLEVPTDALGDLDALAEHLLEPFDPVTEYARAINDILNHHVYPTD